jgi:DNA-binding transcriptional ArsR family regulator
MIPTKPAMPSHAAAGVIALARPTFQAHGMSFRNALGQIIGKWARMSASQARARPSPCMPPIRVLKLNHMVQYTRTRLDSSFAALSDTTRRGVLEQLGRADASITDLAEKFHMTLTGMKKHVGVLEQAGLVTTEKVGRVRTCKLGLRRLEEEAAWIERYRQLWEARFDELDKVVEELKRKEKVDGRKKRE